MTAAPDHSQFDNVRPDRNEARFRLSQSVASIGNWELDLLTHTMWASEEAFRIYGLPINPEHNLPLKEVQASPLPEYRDALDRALQALIAAGTPYDVRFRIRRVNDGAVRLVHSLAQVVRDSDQRPLLVAGTVQDITEREERHQQMVDALTASEERARLAFEGAADAIVIFDGSGRIVQANERAVVLSGRPLSELVGMHLRSLFPPSETEARPFRIEEVLAGETAVGERQLIRPDGSIVTIEVHSRRFADGLAQAIARDLTERRRLEEQLQLGQRMDSVGTLAAGIAHDFNNILVGIMGFADLLATEAAGLTKEQQDAVENIVRASRRAADLVGGLDRLTRPGSQRGETFDLASVLSEVCGVLRETTERIVTKEDRVVRGRYFLRGSSSDLYHALMNLGVNAVQAVLEQDPQGGGFVRFEASEETLRPPGSRAPAPGNWIHLRVADSGIGMTPEVRRRAFDPLFSTKGKGNRGGQGLGLTMVYNIVVRQFGGFIDVETGRGAGTTFHLYLPRAEPLEAPQPVATERTAQRASARATVLVVDDEPQIVHLARRVLEGEGHRVVTATSGAEALELFDRLGAEIDLVILDQNMPRLSGTEALARFRTTRPSIQVIVSTGGGTIDAQGSADLLPKPYTATELRQKVRKILAGCYSGRPTGAPPSSGTRGSGR